MKKQQMSPRDHHMLYADYTTVDGSANISVGSVVSHIKPRTVMFCTRARLQRVGEHQTKGELEEEEKEKEIGEMTGVKPEAWTGEVIEARIDVGNRQNVIRETNPLAPLETESKELTEEIENLKLKKILIKREKI